VEESQSTKKAIYNMSNDDNNKTVTTTEIEVII
jgi:hypothetical protein